jgi:SRSO17 transposase
MCPYACPCLTFHFRRATPTLRDGMTHRLDTAGQRRLDRYFDKVGSALGRQDRHESFALYAIGLFSDAERKSVEPIAAMACGDEDLCRAYHDQLLHFVGVSPWSDRDARSCASRYARAAMTAQETIDDWIINDTGFPKQGNKSPGVQRPYSGPLGKTGNCQIGVSVTIATRG